MIILTLSIDITYENFIGEWNGESFQTKTFHEKRTLLATLVIFFDHMVSEMAYHVLIFTSTFFLH